MKHLLLAYSALVAGTVVLCAQQAPPAPPGVLAVTNVPAPPATNAGSPKIQFATREGDFGKVRNGDVVKYTYWFTNTGCETLKVLHVAPGCGCTTAGDWTKTVEPGKTGSIPIQFQTVNFNGPVTKFITVSCDDPSQRTVMLQLKGTIWKVVDVNPPFLSFTVPADGPSTPAVVTITNNTEEPLFLAAPQSSNPAFTAEVKTNQPGKGYQLLISRVPPLNPGVSQAQITLKTSFTNPAVLTVTAWANVQAPISVLPAQLTLPQAPLTATQSFVVTVQNSTTNPIALSEPAVTLEGVTVQIRELQPGRYFNASLTFPAGFELPQGKPAEFSVKSTHPKFPLIKVPILQLPRPATPPQTLPAPQSTAGKPNPVPAVLPRSAPRTLPMPPPAPPAPPAASTRADAH